MPRQRYKEGVEKQHPVSCGTRRVSDTSAL